MTKRNDKVTWFKYDRDNMSAKGVKLFDALVEAEDAATKARQALAAYTEEKAKKAKLVPQGHTVVISRFRQWSVQPKRKSNGSSNKDAGVTI